MRWRIGSKECISTNLHLGASCGLYCLEEMEKGILFSGVVLFHDMVDRYSTHLALDIPWFGDGRQVTTCHHHGPDTQEGTVLLEELFQNYTRIFINVIQATINCGNVHFKKSGQLPQVCNRVAKP